MQTAIKHIDIAEPIWKTRSVGLAVDDVPMGEDVKVTISYRKKGDGSLLYPGEYNMSVDKIRTYPREKVRGNVMVHLVPIADLAKEHVFNNSNQNNMLFDSKTIGDFVKKSEEEKQGSYDNKKLVEPGKHIMTMVGVELSYSKKDKNPMIVVELQLDEEHRTIKEFFKIQGPNTDIPREKLIRLFHRGFGYALQPCNTEKDLIDQLLKFKGKQLTIAVRGRKSAYSFQKDGKDIVMETMMPELWYAGTTAEYDDFYIDMDKAVIDLSDEDKDKLIAFAELNGGPYVPQARTESTSAPAAQPSPAAEPAPQVPPAPVEEPKAETPAPEASAPESSDGDDDDDFLFG